MGQYYVPCIIVVKNGIAEVVAWVSSRGHNTSLKLMSHAYLNNSFVDAFEWVISPEGPHYKGQVVWAGDYGDREDGYDDKNIHSLCTKSTGLAPTQSARAYPLLVNHSKKCFVDKREIDGEMVHPLPLLTREGELGAGGDYKGINMHFLGIWSRDSISVENEAPEGYEKVSYEFRSQYYREDSAPGFIQY